MEFYQKMMGMVIDMVLVLKFVMGFFTQGVGAHCQGVDVDLQGVKLKMIFGVLNQK